MGSIISRFRKKKTTIEILEDLELKIKEIEKYGQTTEQRQKKVIGRLVIYSVILYIMTALIFYFYFFPASLYDQIFYIVPLLIFPILILLTKKLVSWYYKRKLTQNETKLSTMQQEKKKILEQVTETETYKKAKEILLKFAPDQLKMTPLSPPVQKTPGVAVIGETPQRISNPQINLSSMTASAELRRRVLSPISRVSATPSIGVTPLNINRIPTSALTPLPNTPYHTGKALPRPIIPQQRSFMDRLVDYLVGDGPSNRYALICCQCGSHNGMALKEEFEYLSFRCWNCNFWNAAKKQKPSAPKLQLGNITSPTGATLSIDSLIDSPHILQEDKNYKEKNKENEEEEHTGPTITEITDLTSTVHDTPSPSDTDSDIEVVERPNELEEHNAEKSSNNADSVTEHIEQVEKIEDDTGKKEHIEQMEIDEEL
ncbi:endoplasmic reticulum junction formation protein lunapark-B [Prorops nasuta]|uniref:endoplasmic reticulum junction formation protein lunapark-B n=1 Tax=Prorops nasuta TaxID=863751 RepID=UPI0034CF35D4